MTMMRRIREDNHGDYHRIGRHRQFGIQAAAAKGLAPKHPAILDEGDGKTWDRRALHQFWNSLFKMSEVCIIWQLRSQQHHTLRLGACVLALLMVHLS